MLCNRIEAEIEKVLGEKKEWFSEKMIHNITVSINRVGTWKNLMAILLFADFSKAFDPIHSGKITYCFSKENIMRLYRYTRVKIRSQDGVMFFINIVAGVLHPIFVLYLVIICLG